MYRRAACIEEFWDIITAAHVENGHIGMVHTFSAVCIIDFCLLYVIYLIQFVAIFIQIYTPLFEFVNPHLV